MKRAAPVLLPVMAVLAACSSAAHSPGVAQAAHQRAATGAASSATPGGSPAAVPSPSAAAPARGTATSATPVPAGHTGHIAGTVPSGPMTPHAPAPGTYAYTRTDDSGSQDLNVSVSALQGNSDTLTWHSSSGTQSGQLDMTLSWPGSAVSVTTIMYQAGTVSYSCTLSPPVELAPSPLAVGDAWSSDSTCTLAGGTVHWTEQDHVTGTATVQVGRVSVPTYVVAASRSVTITSATSAFTSNTSATDWFGPSLGLEVRDQSTTSSSSGGGQSKTTTSTLQLDSTQPQ